MHGDRVLRTREAPSHQLTGLDLQLLQSRWTWTWTCAVFARKIEPGGRQGRCRGQFLSAQKIWGWEPQSMQCRIHSPVL